MRQVQALAVELALVLAAMAIKGVAANGKYEYVLSEPTDRHAERPSLNSVVQESVLIWPMPASATSGWDTLTLAKDFDFVSADDEPPKTLSGAFLRYSDIIFKQHVLFKGEFSDAALLKKLVVSLDSSDEELQYEVDESYTLQVPDPENPMSALLQAATVYGALRGLETFSQLSAFNFTTRTIQIDSTPWVIEDYPRFAYRGLLIDTSRHYQPLESIKHVIDSMSYAKLNVLHWHIVDEQSFPLEIPSYPRLWKGAYSYGERYTRDDAQDIVEYARARGIHVMAELDVPGHAASWGVGYPTLWPSPECTMPLDISNNFTSELIDGIIGDFKKIFPFNFVHLGGDEVNTSCWETTPHIQTWLLARNMTTFDGYADFVVRAQAIALKHGYQPVNWEETFNNFPWELNKATIVHNWLQGGVCPKVVAYGLRCILSDQGTWYLDHLDVTWEQFYMTEPLINIFDKAEQNLVIGGEVCMWGETVDASDILQTIWPRAAAAAERLWSPIAFTQQGAAPALQRIQTFRCLLNQRGIPAAPVLFAGFDGFGRTPPSNPGSCYQQ